MNTASPMLNKAPTRTTRPSGLTTRPGTAVGASGGRLQARFLGLELVVSARRVRLAGRGLLRAFPCRLHGSSRGQLVHVGFDVEPVQQVAFNVVVHVPGPLLPVVDAVPSDQPHPRECDSGCTDCDQVWVRRHSGLRAIVSPTNN